MDPISIGAMIGAMGVGSSAAGAGLGGLAGAAAAAPAAATGIGAGTLASGAAGLGALASGAGSLMDQDNLTGGATQPQVPQAQAQPARAAPKPKSSRPTFLGENTTPAVGQFGSKTLLGQ